MFRWQLVLLLLAAALLAAAGTHSPKQPKHLCLTCGCGGWPADGCTLPCTAYAAGAFYWMRYATAH